MTIVDKLQRLLFYYDCTRRVGHTRAVLQGVERVPCIIMAHTYGWALDLSRQCATGTTPFPWSGANFDVLRGWQRPLVLDNSAMVALLREALHEIDRLSDIAVRSEEQLTGTDCGSLTNRPITVTRIFDSVSDVCAIMQRDP